MTDRELMQQALDALEYEADVPGLHSEAKVWGAITALRERLARDEQEPVFDRRWSLARDGFGLQRDDQDGNYVHIDDALAVLHAAPQPREWRGLTDVERIDLGVISKAVSAHSLIGMVEAALKEKNA